MKYSIMGFNQEKVLNETNLDLVDLLLVDYIIRAQGTPNMQHILDDGECYVWLSHKKVQDDLPILNISEGTLRNRLSTLKKEEIIKSKQVTDSNFKGTKTYYAITEKTMSLINDMKDSTMSFKNDVVDIPCHSKMTSDILLNNNINNISNDILNEKSEDKKPKRKTKKNLYEQCYDEIIYNFDDTELIKKLDEFLRLCLKEKWVQFLPQWKYKLKDLQNVDGDKLQSVEQTLKQGWKSFYDVKNNSYKPKKFTDMQKHSERVREEDIVDVKF